MAWDEHWRGGHLHRSTARDADEPWDPPLVVGVLGAEGALEVGLLEENPEHVSLERLGDKGVAVGAKLKIREKVAGIPMEGIGEITSVEPQPPSPGRRQRPAIAGWVR